MIAIDYDIYLLISFFESHSVNSVVMNPMAHVNIRRKKVFVFLNFV